jgi:transcriptional regulator with XRE-family HTH domain
MIAGGSIRLHMGKQRELPAHARNIRRLRLARGLTHDELAHRAGLASTRMIEGGYHGGRMDTLRSIATALGVTLDELLADDAAPAPPALAAFLASPAARGITDDEIRELRRVHWTGHEPTEATYYFALQTLRSMTPTGGPKTS